MAINFMPAPALPTPLQFGAPPQMQKQPFGGQGMAILQAALRGRPAAAANPNAPVNPGAPPPAGDPAYFPGGQGPVVGGPGIPPMGMLAQLLQGFGGGAGGGSPGTW